MSFRTFEKIFYLSILVCWVSLTSGIFWRAVGTVDISYIRDYSTITVGSLLNSNPPIEVDWGGYDIYTEEGIGEKILVEITAFNQWDGMLFLPFYQAYQPKVKGTVKKASGKFLGQISLSDKFEFYGLYGRAGILHMVRESYSKQIVNYLRHCQGENWLTEDHEVVCHNQLSFTPFLQLDSANQLKGSPMKTYYCLKPKHQWTDTIYFSTNHMKMPHLVSYETVEFDRKRGHMVQRRYYGDHQLFLLAHYDIWNREGTGKIFTEIKTFGEGGGFRSFGVPRSVEIFEWKRLSE
ncbi:MAG: hypothetical protein AAF587_29400 [Bacteroidota bacterium]